MRFSEKPLSRGSMYVKGAISPLRLSNWTSQDVTFGEYKHDSWNEIILINGNSIRICYHLGYSKVRDFGKTNWEEWESGHTICPPNAERHIEITGGAQMNVAVLSCRFIEAILEQDLDRISIPTVLKPSRDMPLLRYLSMLLREISADDRYHDALMVESVGSALVAALFHQEPKKSLQIPRKHASLMLIADFIEEHLSEDLNLLRIAQEASLSVRELTRAFKYHFGKSVHRYVLERRIARTVSLIRLGMPLFEVGPMVGFDSRPGLANALRKVAGLTVTDVRNGARYNPPIRL